MCMCMCLATQFNQPTPYFACKHIARNESISASQRNWAATPRDGYTHFSHSSNDKMPSILLRAIKITARVYPNNEDKWKLSLHAITYNTKNTWPDESPSTLSISVYLYIFNVLSMRKICSKHEKYSNKIFLILIHKSLRNVPKNRAIYFM